MHYLSSVSHKSTGVPRGSVINIVVPRSMFSLLSLSSSNAAQFICLACFFLWISMGKDSALANVCIMFLILCSFVPV